MRAVGDPTWVMKAAARSSKHRQIEDLGVVTEQIQKQFDQLEAILELLKMAKREGVGIAVVPGANGWPSDAWLDKALPEGEVVIVDAGAIFGDIGANIADGFQAGLARGGSR